MDNMYEKNISLTKIFHMELESILDAFRKNFIFPLYNTEKINRRVLSYIAEDLKEKINSTEINFIPQNIRFAYEKFYEIVISFQKSTDEEMLEYKDTLIAALHNLIISCSVRNGSIFGVNNCRSKQYTLRNLLEDLNSKPKGTGHERTLEKGIGQMLEICKSCPFSVYQERPE